MIAHFNSGRGNSGEMTTTDCLCEANSITCHHPSSVVKTAVLAGYRWTGKKMVSKIELKVPPPRPEPTAHLAVLRNSRHPELKARPSNYLSPALCNISSIYVKRVVEPEARKQLINRKDVSEDVSFSLAVAQRRELRRQRKEEERFMQRREGRANALARAGIHMSSCSNTSNPSSSFILDSLAYVNVAHGRRARGNFTTTSHDTSVIVILSRPAVCQLHELRP